MQARPNFLQSANTLETLAFVMKAKSFALGLA